MRYAPPYTVIPNIDCSGALDHVEIAARDTSVRRVNVRKLAVIAEISLHVGRNGPAIPMAAKEDIEFPDVPCDAGIYLSCAAGGGGALATLVVIHDGGKDASAFRVRAT